MKITAYPQAYRFFKDTNQDLQARSPRGYFTLPRAGVYVKGVSHIAQVGGYFQEGLPDVNAGNWQRYMNSYSLNFRGGGGSDDAGKSQVLENLSLSRFNGVYGRTKNVELNRNHLLEAYYVGEPIL